MTLSNNPWYCADIIRAAKPNFTPRVAFILGSGLGALADQIDDAVSLSYEKLPGFPVSTVHGHAGELVLGHLAGFSPLIVREAVEPQTVLAMISMGMGITLAADSYAQMQWPGVVFRPLKERIPADLYVVHDEKQATPAVMTLIKTLTGA